MKECDVLVIGAGHSGAALVAELRRGGFAGSITLVNGENALPYHRPALSKAWLKGESDEESGWLQPADFYVSHGIEVLFETRIVGLDVDQRIARTDSGDTIRFTNAVIATGAIARPLPTAGAQGLPLLRLRDATDAQRLKRAVTAGNRLAIIGGGFIGLEVAATARMLGASVCVIEREPRLLARLASPELSAHLLELHRRRGVAVLLNTEVTRLASDGDGSLSLGLGPAGIRRFDHVLVAIGALPEDALAREAGLDCENGVVVDERGRTSARHVFAIGDVTQRPLGPFARSARLESVHNANEQARIVAAEILGQPVPPPATPWFWSDQYETKLQIAGLLSVGGEVEVRGDPETNSFSLRHSRDGRLVCVEAINDAREFALGRRQIATEAAALTT